MRKLKDYTMLTAGTLMVTAGIYFFKFPNNFSTGGVSGISVILRAIFPGISAGTFVMIINVALLMLAFIVFGRHFGIRTVYCSLLMSVSLWVLERTVPMSSPLTKQPMLELVFSVLLPAFGSALLFNSMASTGGTDIVAMILRKYTSLDIGKALFCTDFLIATASGIVYGVETGLFSLLGLFSKALVVDSVIENINLTKYFTVITDNPQKVCEYIKNTLGRGATLVHGEGVYLHKDKGIVLTVLNRSQAIKLRNFVKLMDNESNTHSFVIITNTSEIIGRGFRETA